MNEGSGSGNTMIREVVALKKHGKKQAVSSTLTAGNYTLPVRAGIRSNDPTAMVNNPNGSNEVTELGIKSVARTYFTPNEVTRNSTGPGINNMVGPNDEEPTEVGDLSSVLHGFTSSMDALRNQAADVNTRGKGSSNVGDEILSVGKKTGLVPTVYNVANMFGVMIASLKDIDTLTRSIEAGECDNVLDGLNSDERKAAMDAIMALFQMFLADKSDQIPSIDMEQVANYNSTRNVVMDSMNPCGESPIVKSVFINTKPASYAGVAGSSSSQPNKGKVNFRSMFSENLCDGVDLTIPVKVVDLIHDILIKVFSKDGISLIASQIGKPIMLDSFTSSMFIESWGRSSFARCLIEVKADTTLKDSVTMGIPLPDGMGFTKGFTKEAVQVEYEWKPPCCEQCKIFGHVSDQCPKTVTAIPTVDKMNNDGKATWQPIKQKVRYEPKDPGNLPKNGAPKESNYAKDNPSNKLPAKKGVPRVPTSKPSVPTSNPYDVLDDMESEKEAEVFYDQKYKNKS
ncbi:zinc knuckle CX2CX4HX4C containing protein [Tanacetum coccineum]|uniref:Zinc knuckle CX2CX4HX4C containing protein n=1 Tax=Tanacetum coccineum TaxID=301880 RepID=A0ABQ5FI93_9ASTR